MAVTAASTSPTRRRRAGLTCAVALAALGLQTASAFLVVPPPSVSSPATLELARRPFVGRAGAVKAFSTPPRKQKTLAEELDDLRLDESTLSTEEKKGLQSFRDAYKLDNLLDFEGNKGREPAATSSSTSSSGSAARVQEEEEEDPDYDPLDDAEDLAVERTRWSGQAGLDVAQQGTNSWGDVAARPLLAFGDVGFLLAFATLGRSMHSGGLSLDAGALLAAAPFVGAWFLVAPLLGAYTPDATRSTGDALGSLVKAWAVAVPLGLVGRGIIKGEVPPTPFIAVSMVMTLVFLGAWRSLFVALSGGEVQSQGTQGKKSGVLDMFRMVTTLIGRW